MRELRNSNLSSWDKVQCLFSKAFFCFLININVAFARHVVYQQLHTFIKCKEYSKKIRVRDEI